MKISNLLSDDAVLTEIGERVTHHRLNLQLTQSNLAEKAGVSKRTVERIEAGRSAQMSNIVRVLRVLGLTPGLDYLIPEVTSGPMDLLKRRGKVRKRASGSRQSSQSGEPWVWGEDK